MSRALPPLVTFDAGGVALGELSEGMARRLLVETVESALGFLPEGAAIEICTCHAASRCACRKPERGLLRRILERFSPPPSQAVCVGDLEIDRGAAARAGVAFDWAADFFGRGR